MAKRWNEKMVEWIATMIDYDMVACDATNNVTIDVPCGHSTPNH